MTLVLKVLGTAFGLSVKLIVTSFTQPNPSKAFEYSALTWPIYDMMGIVGFAFAG